MGKTMAEKLILIRHGEVEPRYRNRLIGATDISLGPEGMKQSAELAKHIDRLQPGRCFCSPMKRCLETAELSLSSAGVEIETDEDLREADFGEWEGMEFSEIAERSPDGVNKWALFEPGFGFPGGERMAGFLERVKSVSGRLTEVSEEKVVAFTHGGVIRFMICHLLGLDSSKYVSFNIRHASVTVMDIFDGKGVLSALINAGDFTGE